MCKKGLQIFANLILTPILPLSLKYSEIRYLHCLTLVYFLINLSNFCTVCLMLMCIQYFLAEHVFFLSVVVIEKNIGEGLSEAFMCLSN